ncbi:MAG: hypothetical protein ACRBBW_09170 [Cellvibrionaceae bacterium]
MSDSNSTEKQEAPVSRRQLLATAAKFSAVLAVLGASGCVLTPSEDETPLDPETEALQLLLDMAIEAGDMDAAIEKYGAAATLNEAQIDALKSLTSDELKDLELIRERLDLLEDVKFRGRRG